ncbi:MAG TPA: hypothetical protein VIT18_05580 [Terrimicrobiaceae bacterium]
MARAVLTFLVHYGFHFVFLGRNFICEIGIGNATSAFQNTDE